jgi:ribonuclease P protein component
MREAHVPTEHQTTQEASRLPVAHAHPRRPGRDQGPSPARPHAPLGLIRPVRGRATFAALARAKRHARNAIAVRSVPGRTDTAPRVAYGVGRAVGGAVERNRVRRRLRAAVAECEPDLVPGAAYLVSADREVLTMPFVQLVDTLRQALEASGQQTREDA